MPAPSPSTKPSRSASKGLLVPDARERGHVGEAGQRGDGVGRLGAAGDHGVAAVPGDQPSGVADRMGRGRAGRADRLARPLEAVAHGDGGAAGVGHHHRHEERRHPPLALLHPDDDLLLEGVQAADARADDDAGAAGIGVQRRRPARGPRPPRRARTAGRGRRGGLPSGCRTTGSDPSPATASTVPPVGARSEEALPERLLADPARRHDAVAGDRRPDGRPRPSSRAWRRPGRRPGRRSRCPRDPPRAPSMPNSSSRAMTSSTRSRLSASRSSPNFASGTTLSSSTDSTSTAHLRKRANSSSSTVISLSVM